MSREDLKVILERARECIRRSIIEDANDQHSAIIGNVCAINHLIEAMELYCGAEARYFEGEVLQDCGGNCEWPPTPPDLPLQEPLGVDAPDLRYPEPQPEPKICTNSKCIDGKVPVNQGEGLAPCQTCSKPQPEPENCPR